MNKFYPDWLDMISAYVKQLWNKIDFWSLVLSIAYEEKQACIFESFAQQIHTYVTGVTHEWIN